MPIKLLDIHNLIRAFVELVRQMIRVRLLLNYLKRLLLQFLKISITDFLLPISL